MKDKNWCLSHLNKKTNQPKVKALQSWKTSVTKLEDLQVNRRRNHSKWGRQVFKVIQTTSNHHWYQINVVIAMHYAYHTHHWFEAIIFVEIMLNSSWNHSNPFKSSIIPTIYSSCLRSNIPLRSLYMDFHWPHQAILWICFKALVSSQITLHSNFIQYLWKKDICSCHPSPPSICHKKGRDP